MPSSAWPSTAADLVDGIGLAAVDVDSSPVGHAIRGGRSSVHLTWNLTPGSAQ